jgi:hypothetical protein
MADPAEGLENHALRAEISTAVSEVLKALPAVLAGWEGGSAAFDALDDYSDIDLTFLVDDHVAFEDIYAVAERALETVSPIVLRHTMPLGRYYKLKDGGDFLFVDLVFIRAGEPDHYLDVERHGHIMPLFDKADWLRPRPVDEAALAAKRSRRLRDLHVWFPASQSFVRKAIVRGHDVEALTTYWAYTVRPLVELLRMRHCPVRWDFGMRYLDRDLPPDVCARMRELVFVRDLKDLEAQLSAASAWGAALLNELNSKDQLWTNETN